MDAARRTSPERINEADAGLDQAGPSSPPPARHRFWWWALGILFVLLLIIGIAGALLDEPLRAYAERELNHRVDGYTFHIGKLDFHPIGLSLDLEGVTVIQKNHPEPPIAQLTQWHASVHWHSLLAGRLVSDQSIDHPVLHITRPQAAKAAKQAKATKDAASADQPRWQDAVLAIYPLQINELTIREGDVTYRENSASKPLHVSHLNLSATNIRNVRSEPDDYPSDVHLDAIVFDKGRLMLDGHADFLSKPYMGINSDISLQDVELVNVLPLTAQRQVQLTQGVLSTNGHVEYSPRTQVIWLKNLTLRDVKLDFVHAAASARKEKDAGQKVARTADTVAIHPTLLLRIDKGSIDNSEFGFVNTATQPHYRVFISETDMYLENWSNRLSQGAAIVRLRGMLMGSGATQINGAFRPETQSPDFDLSVKVWKTQVASLNDLLRAYGGVDVASGVFSVFSEMTVKHGRIDGYLKPLFKDVKAYDPAQDRDKGLLKKIYEKIINAASSLLANTPRGEVATKTDLAGPVDNPKAGTWEMVVTLIQNAFFEAILPGFEGLDKGSN